MRLVFDSVGLIQRLFLALTLISGLGWAQNAVAQGSPAPLSSIQVSTSPAVCAKCGKVHATGSHWVPSSPPSTAMVTTSRPAATSGLAVSSPSGVTNVLSALNGQRARQGIGALAYDPTLQAVAQRRAQKMASMGIKSHPPGSFAPGRYEGVGWSSSYTPRAVMACYTSDPNMRAAGAAMATGRDGVYFAVVYR